MNVVPLKVQPKTRFHRIACALVATAFLGLARKGNSALQKAHPLFLAIVIGGLSFVPTVPNAFAANPEPSPPLQKPRFPCDNLRTADCLVCCFQQGSIAEAACNYGLGAGHEYYCSEFAEGWADSCIDEDC